jgi:branched-chain amino acid transport system ATP-binding protein
MEAKFAVMDTLTTVLREDAVTALFVEHDMQVVRRYADRVLVLSEGQIVADGPRTRSSKTSGSAAWWRGGGDGLQVADLHVTVQGAAILRGVSVLVPDRRIVALVGRNGAGKTTTLRGVMGLVRAQRGQALLDGEDLLRQRPYTRAAHGIGYLPEDRRLIPQLTVEENLRVAAWANRIPDEEARQRLAWIYDLMPPVARFKDRPATLLSGGQQKLAALARALTIGHRLLLLDEPFEGLAPALADEMADAIAQARDERDVAVLFVESEQRLVDHLAEDAFTIERGEIIPTPTAA